MTPVCFVRPEAHVWRPSIIASLACLSIAISQPGQAFAASPPPKFESPLEANDALNHFRVPADVRVELVAAEPDVIDPIAIRFDEAGRLWVVEMRDYPVGPPPGQPPLSNIRVLEDRDGDGKFEDSTIFADKLPFPTGLQPWKGGVIVTLAGRVAFMKDTDGDGRVDVDQTWFTGFAEDNTQLRANHPTLALDHQVYIANGLRGGTVFSPRAKKPQRVSLRGQDFRFDPLTMEYEAVAGNGQYGLTFDGAGNRFVCSNRNPVRHVVIENRFASRGNGYVPDQVMHDVAAAGAASQVFPISRAWTTSNLHAGQFTAACGVTIYGGQRLPPSYHGNAFVCEPTGNLVHRERVQRNGSTFSSQPARQGIEFLASPDEWFRPVDLTVGPDGALYVADMYRAVIEHPQWVPSELKDRRDTRFGDDRGRIYRLVAKQLPPAAASAKLHLASAAELCRYLEDDNAWRRQVAARLLLERNLTQEVRDLLIELARQSQKANTRIRALWLLSLTNALTESLLEMTLQAADADVRRQSIVLAERHFPKHAPLRQYRRRLCSDADPHVRLQAVLSLTPVQNTSEVADLHKAALLSLGDQWMSRAVKLAVGDRSAELLSQFMQVTDEPASQALREFVYELAVQVGQQHDPKSRPKNASARISVLAAIGDSLEAGHSRPVEGPLAKQALLGLLASQRIRPDHLFDGLAANQVAAIQSALEQAVRDAQSRSKPVALRVEALRLAAHHPQVMKILEKLVRARDEAPAVRTTAIDILAQGDTLEIWHDLLKNMSSESPAIQRRIVSGVLRHKARTTLLLDMIESKKITASTLDRLQVDRLRKSPDAVNRRRAAQLLADAVPQDRRTALAKFQPALQLKANSRHGQQLFKKHCATCHRIGKTGVDVGPDISDSRTRTPRQLLTDILQPNRAIDAGYISYSITTTNGLVLSGVLTTETSTSVTVRQAEGKSLTLARDQLEQVRSNGVSLMPEGLERNLTQQDMADLIGFIKNWRYLDGKTPLNEETR